MGRAEFWQWLVKRIGGFHSFRFVSVCVHDRGVIVARREMWPLKNGDYWAAWVLVWQWRMGQTDAPR